MESAKIMVIVTMILVVLAIALVVFGAVAYYLSFIPLFIRAKTAGVQCTVFRMVGMRLRGLKPSFIIDQMIILDRAGIEASFDELESHVMAGGNLYSVVDAMVSAFKAELPTDFRRLCAIDLAGRDVLKAVAACVNPVVINVPPKASAHITGVAKDGVRLGVNVRVTVRANILKLVGGANEETIIARVGEGIVSTIGGVENHKMILQNPDRISHRILEHGLDARTAFEIVSVDVGDIVVMDNIGAKLQEEQAAADQLIAQARAEARRALAVAANHENRARIREMTALEVENRAAVPVDMAAAYQRGNIWVSPNPVYNVISRKLWDVVS